MKKKILKKIDKECIFVKDLKKLRPLLEGIKVEKDDVRINLNDPSWPIETTSNDDALLRMGIKKISYLNEKGLYYVELQDSINGKSDIVNLLHYTTSNVCELKHIDEEARIEPQSFYKFGIGPDFNRYYNLDELKEREDNFVEIIDKEIKKSKKLLKKLSKKI